MEQRTHIDGMRFCLDLIQQLKEKYAALGYAGYQLPIERVLADVENEIGYRAYPNWRPK